MKNRWIFSVTLAALLQLSFSSTLNRSNGNLKFVDHEVFRPGERITYRVHYGLLDAGVAEIRVAKADKDNLLRITGKGESRGMVDMFFKVRDRYETIYDAGRKVPVRFIRKVDEGGFRFQQDYRFDHSRQIVIDQNKDTIPIASGTQDMMSAYYFARSLDIEKYKKGDVISFNTIVDGKIEPLKVRYLGKATVKVDAGKFRCYKFQPLVQKGRVFNDSEDLTIYISADRNKVPVLVKAKILVGSIKMELTSFEGLLYPLAKLD